MASKRLSVLAQLLREIYFSPSSWPKSTWPLYRPKRTANSALQGVTPYPSQWTKKRQAMNQLAVGTLALLEKIDQWSA